MCVWGVCQNVVIVCMWRMRVWCVCLCVCGVCVPSVVFVWCVFYVFGVSVFGLCGCACGVCLVCVIFV